jgi:hypothetical protein
MLKADRVDSVRQKVREHRQRLRGQGLRPIQVWVPDVNAPAFKAEAHAQSLAVAHGSEAPRDQAFIDAVSAWPADAAGPHGDPAQ